MDKSLLKRKVGMGDITAIYLTPPKHSNNPLIAHILKNKKSIVITKKPSGIPIILVMSIISILVLNIGLTPMQQQQQAYATAAIPKTSDLK
jgi:hypothetical protein